MGTAQERLCRPYILRAMSLMLGVPFRAGAAHVVKLGPIGIEHDIDQVLPGVMHGAGAEDINVCHDADLNLASLECIANTLCDRAKLG